ncbi:adventurous gliding motility protein AgmX [Myxococcus xanthus DK 1622]|uniref:Adventurous gliding motility protein AgmX n=2 Tax=Myxococcus xanthus TaxID=34 RepID=Q1D2V2_MYXXD|nr:MULTISPECIES: adventurous gliding motility protein GltJ [Myxococcus]ABF87224.1 adventurous gliding motility protein AgmX [Myxococcus xanthus DK 1622]NOJ56323.1 adventurous gliding motility protein GltJ [Myxococcus xanthus]QPM77395.1 adventurous gliding motility protein GltJ [Myxococcus xanthus]QVW66462.1 adventurous gliding motility protein GltJ [Myxococcus xanthus DZ2]UEO07410.1 adventurous gliding motility protein GltJ [Myxococcus xanthus DZ2]
MRFVCDSCRAQYMISDDKIGPKGVKVRCKKCGHTITVRPAGATAAKDSASESSTSEASASTDVGKGSDASAATMPATLGTPPEGGLFTDVEEDEIGAVFDQVLSSGTQKIPTEAANEAAAREASAENVRKLAEAEAEPDKEEAKANAAAHEWYVAIDEKQVGPFNVEKVKDLWDRGEVGPDSLCWRSGFSDWIPLSETAELASVLAPRPSKPVIVAPEPVSGSTPAVSSGPVQSAFSAGKGARGDSGPAGASEEAVGWKPSAASVLASLVKEENDALSKPPPTPAPALGREPVSQSRLLDVPMPPPEPVSSPSLRGAEVPMAQPMASPMPYGQQPMQQYPQPAPMPYGHQPGPQYAQPMPAPYPPQPSYPAPYPPQGGGKGKTGLFVGIAAGLLLVGGGAAALFLKGGSGADAAQANPPVVAATPVATPSPTPSSPPPPQANTAPVAAAQPPVNSATAPPPPPTEVAAAPVNTPPPETPPTAVAAAPVATPTPPPVETPKPAETAVAKAERPTNRRTSSSSRREDSEPRASAPARAERPSSSDSDDDFDELFGTKKSAPEAKPSSARPTAYVPPEPGGGVPDRLQQSDIMAVVLANKPAIIKCVNEQKKKDPSLSGKLVMRWTIQTSGKTSAVSCRTDEFRTTYMASCISGLIKSWSFPRHKRQGEPIDFPFTF